MSTALVWLINIPIIGVALTLAGCATQRVASTPPAPTTQTTGLYSPRDQTPNPVFVENGNADSVAYVCDASGSMMEKMEALKHELSKSIDDLQPYQKFSVTFFQNESPTYLARTLIPATSANKQKAEQFLADVSTNGSTDPIPGLDIAFRQHPQVVYLLTDGDFPDNGRVLDEIHKLDPDHHVKINTIAFTDSADHDVDFLKLLKQIADESGGTFKSVNEEGLK